MRKSLKRQLPQSGPVVGGVGNEATSDDIARSSKVNRAVISGSAGSACGVGTFKT